MNYQSWKRQGLLAIIALFAVMIVAGSIIVSSQWVRKPFPGFFLHSNMTVGPYFLPQWSGSVAGLGVLDRIVSVEGQPLDQPQELYALVKRKPVGYRFTYEVARRGQILFLRIPSAPFSFQDWFLSFGVFLITGIAFLIIGVTPYYFRSASPASVPLLFMVSTVFVWFGTTFDFMTGSVLPKEIRIFAFTLTPGAGIHLGLMLKSRNPLRREGRIYLVLVYAASIALGWWLNATFFGPVEDWALVRQVAYAYSCFAAVVFLALLWSVLKARLSDLERSRLRVISVGAILGFFLPTLATVLTSSFGWVIPYNLALLPTVCFPLSVAYALLKYSLFDLGNTLKVGLSRITLTALLLMLYVAVVFALSLSVGIYDQDPLIPLFFSGLVVLVFNPLLRWVEGAVDRFIYRQEYDLTELQKEVSLFLRSLSGPQRLADGFIELLSERMGIERAGLVYRLQGPENHIKAMYPGGGAALENIPDAIHALWNDDSQLRYQGISRGEVATSPAFRVAREGLLDIMGQLGSELLIPIVFEKRLRGFVFFGAKRSARIYSADDLKILGILTDQLALSLENGRLFEESERSKEQYRLLYDQAEAINKQLIETDRLKKQFVANISHELRTPISTIMGYAEVLLNPEFRGDGRWILERLVNNGQDLSQLMDSLLDFSRLEAGSVLTRLELVSLKEILDSLSVMTQRLIRGRPIRFQISVESAVDYIQSDAKKLQQILVQLLTNALKFTRQGEIAVNIRTVSQGDSSFLEIAVADTGIGIDQDDQEAIFEEFRQLDGSSTRQYGGTGLGLGLCRKLAQSLGGSIKVTSEIGMGSIFSLLLPMRPPQAQVVGVGQGIL